MNASERVSTETAAVERRAATPIAGAIAGMLFAILFSVCVAIMRGAMSDVTHDSGA